MPVRYSVSQFPARHPARPARRALRRGQRDPECPQVSNAVGPDQAPEAAVVIQPALQLVAIDPCELLELRLIDRRPSAHDPVVIREPPIGCSRGRMRVASTGNGGTADSSEDDEDGNPASLFRRDERQGFLLLAEILTAGRRVPDQRGPHRAGRLPLTLPQLCLGTARLHGILPGSCRKPRDVSEASAAKIQRCPISCARR